MVAGCIFLHVHAAPGDNGLGQGTPGAQGDGQGLERRPQLFTLPTGDLPADALPADACQVGEQGAEPQGQKARQYVLQLLAGLGRKVPLQPEVQLLWGQAGFQIQGDLAWASSAGK